MAERIAAQVPKGSQICIQGKLNPSTWVNREGVKQTKFQASGVLGLSGPTCAKLPERLVYTACMSLMIVYG